MFLSKVLEVLEVLEVEERAGFFEERYEAVVRETKNGIADLENQANVAVLPFLKRTKN